MFVDFRNILQVFLTVRGRAFGLQQTANSCRVDLSFGTP